ncbi:MAG: DUF4230 domain-containing protein [Prevotella sp.]|nr:DUF4230 domain-containing protein [Prevotella sp.]
MRIPKISTLRWMAVVCALVITIIILVYFISCSHHNSVKISTDDKINITPEQIAAIKNIGQWEFLAVSDEEMVDTVRKGIFSDDELIRIYYGTLRMGIDMHKVGPHWIKIKDKDIEVILPPITLLDNDFIDEARTISFFESGKWTENDKQDMYNRAYLLMKEKCLTHENKKSAEYNAGRQLYSLFKNMRYENIKIRFSDK